MGNRASHTRPNAESKTIRRRTRTDTSASTQGPHSESISSALAAPRERDSPHLQEHLSQMDSASRSDLVIQLQQTRGNAYVQRLADGLNQPQKATGRGQAVQRQPQGDAGARWAHYTPKLSIEPQSSEIEVGKELDIALRVLNPPSDVEFDWLLPTVPDQVLELVDYVDTPGPISKFKVKGIAPGAGRITVQLWDRPISGSNSPGRPEQPRYISVNVKTTSAVEALNRLKKVEENRDRGLATNDQDKLAAEEKAKDAALEMLRSTKGFAGDPVRGVLSHIENQIGVIQQSRALGYVEAIQSLHSKEMDSLENPDAFYSAMEGNLLWALSGLLPWVGVAASALKGLRGLGKGAAALRDWFSTHPFTKDAITTVLGTGGAMYAQFSGGVPKGAKGYDVLEAMKSNLGRINSDLCNHQRRQAPILLLEAMTQNPPSADDDVETYVAAITWGLRQNLYGDVYGKGLNDGELVSGALVQREARNELLRQYVAGSSAISGGKIEASKPVEGHNVVSNAMELITDLQGKKTPLEFRPFELVVNQMRLATAEVGAPVPLDEDQIGARLMAKNGLAIPIPNWDYSVLYGPYPSHWSQLVSKGVIKQQSKADWGTWGTWAMDPKAYRVSEMQVYGWDLDKMQQDGKTIYSLKQVLFKAVKNDGAQVPQASKGKTEQQSSEKEKSGSAQQASVQEPGALDLWFAFVIKP